MDDEAEQEYGKKRKGTIVWKRKVAMSVLRCGEHRAPALYVT